MSRAGKFIISTATFVMGTPVMQKRWPQVIWIQSREILSKHLPTNCPGLR